MDANILKNIISSSAVTFTAESAKEWDSVRDVGEFPVMRPTLITFLSKSFTKLLTYKVSPQAYQRYSVRLHIIETLRNWSRIEGDLGKLPLFQHLEESHKFLFCLLKKYLSEKIINSCDNVDNLVQLAEILFGSLLNNTTSKKYLNTVIERISSLKQSEKSEKFLQHVLEKNYEFKLESSLIEKIYTTQKFLFIEKPLDDCFSEFYLDESLERNFDKIDFIFEKVVDSPSLFYSISNHLKNLFVFTKYSQKSQSFIQKVLNKIQLHCNKYKKDSLDLYPTNLQFCVVLLRIEPGYHNETSKMHTVHSLKQIFLEDNKNALILVSHFPEWLSEYLKFFQILEEPSQTTESQQNIIEIN